MHVRLPDGRLLVIRPIRAEDKPLLGAALARLSPESARARFLTAKPRLTSSELAYLTEVDGCHHFALVAVPADRPLELAGVARYVRLEDDPGTAEMAIVIADDLQGRGLGKLLAFALADHARDHGVQRFTGLMLRDNRAAHRLFAALAHHMSTRRDQAGVDRVVAELAA